MSKNDEKDEDKSNVDVDFATNVNQQQSVKFIPFKNIPQSGMGYFENDDATAYIAVNNDKIIYNKYEDKNKKAKYKKGERTTIVTAWTTFKDQDDTTLGEVPKFINILGQTAGEIPKPFGQGSGFRYDKNKDIWISKSSRENKMITWSRRSYVSFVLRLVGVR